MSKQAELTERARALAPLIRAHADQSERERKLAAPIVEALHDAGLFRMMLPESLGGSGLNAAEAAPILEEVACADGSAGWNLAIGAGNSAFLALLEDEAAIAELAASPRALGAGSINPTSLRLTPAPGGYRVSGALRYASGIQQSTWLVAGGFVIENGRPRTAPDGGPLIVGTFFPTDAARVLDSWRPTGMCGTGSHDALVEDVFVPYARTYDFRTTAPRPLDPLAALPIFSRLGATLSAVGLGIARRAREELITLAQTKTSLMSAKPLRETARVQIDVARATALTDAGRAQLASTVSEIYARIAAGAAPTREDQIHLRLAYISTTDFAAQAVDLMRNAAGMNAVVAGSPLERCWRDMHALTQHLAVSSAHYERIGKALLGVEIGPGPL
ncbi:MAG TPA: acyl-CoA dehydrogenase family protein [Myxococcota bacterium]|nr:acyl-CoA dehydrogenase family protein [Myxococcota bacterium]